MRTSADQHVEFDWPDSFERVRAKRPVRLTVMTEDEGVTNDHVMRVESTPWTVVFEIYGPRCTECGESPYSKAEKSCQARGERHNLQDDFVEVVRSRRDTLAEALAEADRMLQEKIAEYRIV